MTADKYRLDDGLAAPDRRRRAWLAPPPTVLPPPQPLPQPPLTLSGVVYEHSSSGVRPLAGVALDVSPPGAQHTSQVTIDGDGRYHLAGLSGPRYKVNAEARGYLQPCRGRRAHRRPPMGPLCHRGDDGQGERTSVHVSRSAGDTFRTHIRTDRRGCSRCSRRRAVAGRRTLDHRRVRTLLLV